MYKSMLLWRRVFVFVVVVLCEVWMAFNDSLYNDSVDHLYEDARESFEVDEPSREVSSMVLYNLCVFSCTRFITVWANSLLTAVLELSVIINKISVINK